MSVGKGWIMLDNLFWMFVGMMLTLGVEVILVAIYLELHPIQI